jgi:hypothetical protein
MRTCKTIALNDITETRIPWALSRRVEFLVENRAIAKVFGKVSRYRSRRLRGGTASSEIYTQS